MPEIEPIVSDKDQRRLWFDYIKTLNDRSLQSAQRSGITTYVLLATLLGLLYKFGPLTPPFLSRTDELGTGIVVFVLEVIVLSSFGLALTGIEIYCAGDIVSRAHPKSAEASVRISFALATLLAIGFICLELRVATHVALPAKGIRYLLWAHALWLAVNIIFPIFRFYQLAKKARDIKYPLPQFFPFRLPPAAHLPALGVTACWLLLGIFFLIVYLRATPPYWNQSLKAASITLVVISIVVCLIWKSISSANLHRYFGLERDIVLNSMTSAEIRDRYLSELTGPDMAQWLDDALNVLDKKRSDFDRELASSEEKLRQIQNISTEYPIERKARAKETLANLETVLDECLNQLSLLNFQSDFFISGYRTQEENNALHERFKVLREKTHAFREKVEPALRLRSELKKLEQ